MATTWEFGGTNLSTLGNITNLDDNFDMPDRRGSNIVIPFRHGTVHADKFFDERTLTFGIAVLTANATALEAMFDTIFALFTPQQRVLQVTRNDGSVRTSTASVNKSLQVTRLDNRSARIVVEFTLADPYFRLSTLIADNTTTINASPKAMTVTNTGTVEERDPIITLTGPLANTVITNSTNGCVLTYTGTIAAPRVVTIQTVSGEYTATTDLGANVIGNVSHSGSSALMVFNAGANTLSITDDTHTTGTVKASFYPPYI